MSSPVKTKGPDQFRRHRARLWVFLWLIAVLWVLALMGMPSGRISFWMFGGISVACFIAAYTVNFRMVRMSRRREDGFCWKCGYRLEGIESSHCPECGTATTP